MIYLQLFTMITNNILKFFFICKIYTIYVILSINTTSMTQEKNLTANLKILFS